jgi:IPT/TIG domain-containing protein
MRFSIVLLASLLAAGCGAGNGRRPAPATFTSTVQQVSITSVSPGTTPVNSVPFMLTVNGTGFGSDAVVFWNGIPQHTTVLTSKQLVASITPSDLTVVGNIPIFVRTAGLNSNTLDFVVSAQ